MSNNIEEFVQDTGNKITSEIKKSIYDWICAVIIVAIVAASLDMLGVVDLTGEDAGQKIFHFVMQWVPYFMATILLNNTLYKKGVFVGKRSNTFINNSTAYSNYVNSLTGKQIKEMYDFCDEYNDNALKTIQTNILKKEGLSYDDFEKEFTIIKDNVSITKQPLKVWTKKQLLEDNYTKAQIKAINNAKHVHLKGLTVTSLLSSMNIKDPTDIGKNENELARKHTISSTLMYIVTTFIMSLLAIKDITEWGWTGIILVIFKVIYTFARSYMSYFQGYNDITVSLTNHIARKIDILKMYLKYEPDGKEIENTQTVENV